jgi:hypothetical protein
LGTLLSIIFFGSEWKCGGGGIAAVTGSTDNQGNSFATAKMLSSKWPLTVLRVELSEQMRAKKMELQLLWRRRDLNQEADDLTNGIYTAFDPARRIEIDPNKIPWIVMNDLMKDSALLYQSICREREDAKASGPRSTKFGFKKIKASLKLRSRDPW